MKENGKIKYGEKNISLLFFRSNCILLLLFLIVMQEEWARKYKKITSWRCEIEYRGIAETGAHSTGAEQYINAKERQK